VVIPDIFKEYRLYCEVLSASHTPIKKRNTAHLFVEIKIYATQQQAGFGVLLAITCLKIKLN
jgi:hypothetical protein